MKKNLIVTFLFCCLISVYAQEVKIENDDVKVLVFIMPDSMELPSKFYRGARVQDAIIKSKLLSTTLSKLKINKISKALPDLIEIDSIFHTIAGGSVKRPEFHRIYSLSFTSDEEANNAIENLNRIPGVIYAEKDYPTRLLNDDRYIDGTQWHLNNYGQNFGTRGADVNAEGAWNILQEIQMLK